MSENSSISEEQSLPRQNGNGGGRQGVPFPIMRPLSPPNARRTLLIQNQSDIVNVLSYVPGFCRQAMYILSGRGFVSHATLLSLPSRQPLIICIGGNILYMSGWFQPLFVTGGAPIRSSRANGVVHVSLSGAQSVAIADNLIASGTVEVDVVFLCGPGSAFQADAPGEPRVPIRVLVNYILPAAPQAPVAE